MSRVLVPLAQGCEELEAITITDLLVRAGVDVTTAGLDSQPVKASRGTTLIPDTTIEAVSNELFDLIVLPGGLPGADHLRDNQHVQALLKSHAAEGKYIGAICAAPKAIAEAGLLEGKKATGYPGVLAALGNPDITVSDAAIEIAEARTSESYRQAEAKAEEIIKQARLLGERAATLPDEELPGLQEQLNIPIGILMGKNFLSSQLLIYQINKVVGGPFQMNRVTGYF